MVEKPIPTLFITGVCSLCAKEFLITIRPAANGLYPCDLRALPGRCEACQELAAEVKP